MPRAFGGPPGIDEGLLGLYLDTCHERAGGEFPRARIDACKGMSSTDADAHAENGDARFHAATEVYVPNQGPLSRPPGPVEVPVSRNLYLDQLQSNQQTVLPGAARMQGSRSENDPSTSFLSNRVPQLRDRLARASRRGKVLS